MHITEVIIDGFKSYAIRTVISQWDASFNAITGLNGSGKSNILDAICFCLGIAKYDLLRASGGVQDLIYKRGQAGVTKASVTIVFDNNDIDESGKKRLCPVGFEDYSTISVTRQVVLGGTSKYLINGHRAQQQTVQNLFQSVQLNINNPNFLIMQGRVTKVLNMKSTEILGMVEEAAGTRMFEDRREKALRTMAKKQAKVEELEHLLKEEIDPKLERLRGEKRAFLEFQSTQNDLERLTKLVVAYEYVKSREKLRSSKADADAKEERVAQLNENAERLRRELSVLEEDMNRVRNVRENELRKGGRYSSLEEKVKAHSHGMVRLTTVIDLKRAAIQEEDVRLEKASNTSKTLGQQLQEKIDARKILQKKYDKAHTEFEERTAELDIKEELLQTLQTGISSSASSDGGYAGQLTRARDSAAKAGTEIEQSRLKISHLKNRIAEDEPRARQAERDNALLLEGVDTLRAEVAALDSQLLQSGCDPVTVEQQQGEKASTSARVSALRSEIETLSRRTTGLDFSYSDPYPEFDRRKVKGLVAQLFNLPTTATEASTALEICAGGRLYNVVVDSASTGAELLQGGKLRRRVTIVPLDKISAHRASTEQVTAAQKCAPGKVHLAVTLIGYEHEVHKAMEYVFGNTLIAADATTAKKVTFDPAVRLKSVTLEGDVYDPSGTLSGGSTTQSSGILLILRKIGVLRDELGEEERKLSNLEQTMRDNAVKIRSAAQVKQRLELKTHEIILAERQIASNSGSSVIAQVQEMRDTVESLEELIHEAQTRKQDADAEARRIEKEMKDFSSNKTAKLDQLMKESDKLKAVLLKSGHDLRPLQQELREADLDVEQVGIDLATAHEELQDAQGTLIAQQQELESLVQENDKVKFEHDEAIAELEDERRKLGCFDEEISDLEGAAKAKAQQLSDEKLEVQQLGHALETLKKAQMGNSQALKAIQKEHDWVLDDEASFGRAGTPYCFDGQDMKARNVELSLVQERAQGMRRKINPAVMATIDSVEKKERDLKTMMKTVIRDKRKIEETISSLDEYKKEALHKTWSKVNRDFGMIFNDLLPGNTAKLDPLEGKDISEGLEVKVCLGKVWKQSLTELSGGQRSLIALSLILSLLQYSPAPMYILDEVDAALDLSHTQNIGRLIRTRFTGSQFIVVSLKDGMFTNANRIFRTRFMDGTSVVQTLGPADVK